MTDSPAIVRIGHPPAAPKRARRWPAITIALALVALLGAGAAWWLWSPTGAADDRGMEAAQRVAQAQLDAYVGEDYAGAWDTWSAAGKAAITRTDYIRLQTECKPISTLPFTIKSIRPEGSDRAVIIAERGGFIFSYELIFEDHAWRFNPPAENIAGYAKGVDALIAQRKAEDNCF